MNSRELRKRYIAESNRIVVKIGTNVIGNGHGTTLDGAKVDALSEQIASLVEDGRRVAVVSSGAIGAGIGRLGMSKRPTSLPVLQAAAGVGQARLVSRYDRSFQKHGLHAGQVLLTREDFDSRQRYLNAANTLHALFEHRCVPVINENDTIATEEIQFGDNDQLAAFVMHLIRADLLVILTTEPGLCVWPPFPREGMEIGEAHAESKFGHRVDTVKNLGEEVLNLARAETSTGGTGGMRSTLEAAKIAVESGETAVIADGRADNVLTELMNGRNIGTLFLPTPEKLAGRKRWIRFTRRPRGTVKIDAGAVKAIRERGTSLLPTGIIEVKGDFKRSDTVRVAARNGTEVARGLTNYSATDIQKIKGRRSDEVGDVLGRECFDEVIHRDNMAVLF